MKGTSYSYTLSDGEIRWMAQVELPRKNGNRRRLSKGGHPTKEAADLWRAKILARCNENLPVEPTEVSVAELLNRWLEDSAKKSVSESTYAKHDMHIRNHLKPYFGDYSLDEVNSMVIQQFIDEKLEHGKMNESGGLKVRSVQTILEPLTSAFRWAVERNLIQHNPANPAHLDFPKESSRELNVLSESAVKTFLDVSRDQNTYGPLYEMAIKTGMRRCELLGLKWDKVDLQEEVILVRRMLRKIPSGKVVQRNEVKTERSKRTIPIQTLLRNRLIQHKQEQESWQEKLGEDWQGNGYVITNSTNGGAVNPDNIRRHLKKLLDKAGLPQEYTFHDFRSTACTLMLKNGGSLEEVSKWMGHSHVDVTEQIYHKALPEVQKAGAQRLEDAIEHE